MCSPQAVIRSTSILFSEDDNGWAHCPSRRPNPLAASSYNHCLYLLPQMFLALLRFYSLIVMILRDKDAMPPTEILS